MATDDQLARGVRKALGECEAAIHKALEDFTVALTEEIGEAFARSLAPKGPVVVDFPTTPAEAPKPEAAETPDPF